MALTFEKLCLVSILVLFFIGQIIDARQIRINRYSTQIDDDVDSRGGVVDVPLTKLQPAPTLGEVASRSGRAYRGPNNTNVESATDSSLAATTTTEYPWDLSTTTANYDLDSTTISAAAAEDDNSSVAIAARAKAPYPAAGYRPSRAFLLPTEIEAAARSAELAPTTTEGNASADSTTSTPIENASTQQATSRSQKAPYPAAGYRPSRAFLLPTEAQQQKEVEQPPVISNHPICGSNANPLAPKPAPDAEKEPEAENVYVTAAVGPAVISAQVPEIIIRSEPLVSQALFVPRPSFAYSTQWQTW